MANSNSGKPEPTSAEKNPEQSPKADKPDDPQMMVAANDILRWLERFDEGELIPISRTFSLKRQLSDLHPFYSDASPELQAKLLELILFKDGPVFSGVSDIEADVVEEIRNLLGAIVAGHATTGTHPPAGSSPAAAPGSSGGDRPRAEGYTVASILRLTGCSSETLRRYAKAAKVARPQRGKRNFLYSKPDLCRILETIIAMSSDSSLLAKCREALLELQETN